MTEGERRDGRQARWERHNQQRRRQIIDAAIEVIEEAGPGGELHVQQIATRAGVNRTVVYRYFEDRADLDRAVQTRIIELLWEQLMPAVTLEGTVPQIIERLVGIYVDWAFAHPALHHMADHDNGDPDGPLERAIEQIAGEVGNLINIVLVTLGGDLGEDDLELLDPLVHGLIGSVFGSVRRWLNRPHRVLSPVALKATLSQSVWFLLDGHARVRGVVIDPERPMEDMVAEALATVAP
jgi:AcrR family transcriptional regulator